jgi:hypothetical protein
MGEDISFFKDFFGVLLSPRRFFADRFLQISARRLFGLGFLGTFSGLLLGSSLNFVFSNFILGDFSHHQDIYQNAIRSLGLTEKDFIELLHAQKAYAILMAGLSPVIAYMASHIFGGALYIFLWLLARQENNPVNFSGVVACAEASLTAMAFYFIPAFGPLLAIVMIGYNVSKALEKQFQLVGFMKALSIFSAMYITFFLTAATLQLLAHPLAQMLKN